MARIRSIKPGFFLNEQLADLPYQWRLLFIGLWTQADREGRLEDRPMRLKAVLFPYDDLNVDQGLGCLANAGLVIRYDTEEGQRLIAIPTWNKHQLPHVKEQPSELPAPEHVTCTVLAPDLHFRKGADPDPEGSGSGTAAHEARFERFWAVYPRRVGKGAAQSVWMRLKPSDELTDAILGAVEAQAQTPQWTKDGGQFVPHPKTWLSQKRWLDEVEKARPTLVERPFTAAEEKHAKDVRRAWLGCRHEPQCSSYGDCLAVIMRDSRAQAS